MKFRIRIDGVDDAKVISFLSSYPEYIAVHHTVNDNPHYHFYVNATMIMSDQTMRMRVKRFFGTEKASDYSVKKCDDGREDEYIQYMFNTKHGNVWRRVCDSGIDIDRINKCIGDAETVSTEFAKANARKKKSNTVTIFDIAEEATEIFKTRHGEVNDQAEYYYKMAIIAIHLMKTYRKGSDYNMIIKVITTSLSISNPELLAGKVVKYFSERYL